jgi:long-chain fatty acid transport protein
MNRYSISYLNFIFYVLKIFNFYGSLFFIQFILLMSLTLKESKAGSFGLREVSASGEAVSLAGAAVGAAGLGSIYWNPATLTQFDGIQLSTNTTLILPYSKLVNQSDSGSGYSVFSSFFGGSASSGNIGMTGIVPSTQLTYRLNSDMWIGLSLSVPYGQATKAHDAYVGRTYGSTTKVASFEIEPLLSYKVTDRLSVGLGLRIIDFSARYTSAVPSSITPYQWSLIGIQGDAQALAFSTGVLYRLCDKTAIGIGYRSETDIRLKGNFFGGGALAVNFGGSAALAAASLDQPVSMPLKLPQISTFGLKHEINRKWTILGAFEFVQWERLKSPQVSYLQGGTTAAAAWSAGQAHLALPSIPLYYRDAWFISTGAEYRYSDQSLFRGGIAFEKTPLSKYAQSPRLPDFNRIWASIGITYQLDPHWTLDLAYLHIFMLGERVKIDQNSVGYSPALTLSALDVLDAKAQARVEIISLGLTYKFDTTSLKR